MSTRRRTPGELLLNGLPIAVGAVAGYYGAQAAIGPGTWRIVLTVVLFGVTGLLVGFAVDRLNGRRRKGRSLN